LGSEKANCSLGTIGLFRSKELIEKPQRGFLPASDRHILTQCQQILLALKKNTQLVVSSRFSGELFEKIIFCALICVPLACPLIQTILKCPALLDCIGETDMSMSEPVTTVPLTTDQYAKRVFAELHQTIILHEQGALTGDIESIHDMRVAIRRQRVALSNFAVCLSSEDRRRLRVRLERLSEALGGVRDLDIMIEALGVALPARPVKDHQAILALIRRLKARRRRKYHRLVEYLHGEEYTDFKSEFPAVEALSQRSDRAEHGQAA
jgi:CHAD domain